MQRPSEETDDSVIPAGGGPAGESGSGSPILSKLRRIFGPPPDTLPGEKRSRLGWPLLAAFVMAIAIANFPRHPYVLDDALSEKAVLNFAHEHDLKFGKDIVFTYGPLGYLSSRYFFEHAAGLRMASELAVCLLISMGLCLLAWRLPHISKWTLLLVGLFVLANVDPRADLVLYVGIFCWGLLCMVESGRRLGWCIGAFCVVAVYGMLTKANFLVAGGLCAAAIMTDYLIQRRFKPASVMAVGLGAGFIAGWLMAGQRLPQIVPFFTNSISIMRNYDQTVGLEGLEMLHRRGLEAVLLAMAAALSRGLSAFDVQVKERGWRPVVMTCWWLALIFLIWKHGFVRADLYHAGFCFGFLPILVVALAALPSRAGPLIIWGRLAAAGCCVLSLLTLQQLFFSSLKGSLSQPGLAIVDNLKSLVRPASYRAEMEGLFEGARRFTDLPELRQKVGRSTVDVFGQEQAYAIFNTLNFTPRPVFQSYLAFNSRLMGINQDFYLGDSAPDYVLFHLAPIDRKFPPLEDAFLLRHLFINYAAAASEQQFLLLKRKSSAVPKLKLLAEASVRMGERINLSKYGETNLWMEIEAWPSWRGRLREFLSKPGKLRLAVWANGPAKKMTRSWAPSPMLQAGFLASPLLLRNEDFLDAAGRGHVIRPESYAVQCDPGTESHWNPRIRYRIYEIENEISEAK